MVVSIRSAMVKGCFMLALSFNSFFLFLFLFVSFLLSFLFYFMSVCFFVFNGTNNDDSCLFSGSRGFFFFFSFFTLARNFKITCLF